MKDGEAGVNEGGLGGWTQWWDGRGSERRCWDRSVPGAGGLLSLRTPSLRSKEWGGVVGGRPSWGRVRGNQRLKAPSGSAFTGGHWRRTHCRRQLPFICSY